MLNKIIKLLAIVILILSIALLVRQLFQNKETWYFIGYQYKWNEDYVDNSELKSQKDCIEYGFAWLEKQTEKDALFTCANNCKDAGLGGLLACDQVCEYGKRGLIQCRR